MALGEARRGSIAPRLCDRGATKPKAILGATLRAAVLFASRVVARSLQTHGGHARRPRPPGGAKPLGRDHSQLGGPPTKGWSTGGPRLSHLGPPESPNPPPG